MTTGFVNLQTLKNTCKNHLKVNGLFSAHQTQGQSAPCPGGDNATQPGAGAATGIEQNRRRRENKTDKSRIPPALAAIKNSPGPLCVALRRLRRPRRLPGLSLASAISYATDWMFYGYSRQRLVGDLGAGATVEWWLCHWPWLLRLPVACHRSLACGRPSSAGCWWRCWAVPACKLPGRQGFHRHRGDGIVQQHGVGGLGGFHLRRGAADAVGGCAPGQRSLLCR